MGGYPEDEDEAPKGVGAFVAIGGYEEEAADDPLPFGFTDAPNGVGALLDIGGYPEAPEAPDEPNGVGALADIGGYPEDEVV